MKSTFTLVSVIGLLVFSYTVSPAQQSKAPTATPQVITKNQSVSSKVIDAPGFPVLKHTGNSVLDAQNYEEAKAKWVRDNPELYKSLTANSKSGVTRVPRAKFDQLPKEKQDAILKQPEKYIVE